MQNKPKQQTRVNAYEKYIVMQASQLSQAFLLEFLIARLVSTPELRRVVKKNSCKILWTLQCFGGILISSKTALLSHIQRQATKLRILVMTIIIIIWENVTKTFPVGQDVYTLLLSGSESLRVKQQHSFWVIFVASVAWKVKAKPLCCCWEADPAADKLNGPLESRRKRISWIQ